MRGTALLALLLIAGCPAPPVDGVLGCGQKPAHRCPSGYDCVGDRCYRTGHVFDMSIPIEPEDLALAADLQQVIDLAQIRPSSMIDDTFPGPMLETGIWTKSSGTVTIVDDTPNGATTAAKVDGGSFESSALGLAGDFKLRGRLRVTGATPQTYGSFGLRGDHDWAFLVWSSTWQVFVNGMQKAPSPTVPLNANYAMFEIKRVGATVTLSMDGTVLFSGTGASLVGDTIRTEIGGGGAMLVDRIEFTDG